MIEKTLYCQDARGDIREWTVSTDGFQISYEWGLLDGHMQEKTEEVEVNQSGRDYAEQAFLQFNSRISKQRDRGYVDSIEEAKKRRTNPAGFPRPMLATKFNSVKNIDYNDAYVQRKYDGNRCLVANRGGQIIAYTRNGKPVETCGHIMEGIQIPEGTILDGELYSHGESLQTIVSWIKRKQSNTTKLKFHCYDMIHKDAFPERLLRLADFDLGAGGSLAETRPVSSDIGALEALSLYRSEGYEGAILRWGKWGYEDGKRSKSLVKMKEWHDKEFKVMSITPSKDGWAILHMDMPNGQEFRATAPGTVAEKIHTYYYRHDFVGKYVTIEYAYLTKDGVPFHPIAKAWRNK